jgi:DnaK suppressor protein
MMTQQDLLSSRATTLRSILEAQRAATQEELERVAHALREQGPTEAQDEGDRANQDQQDEQESARLTHLAHALRQMDDALARHAAGRYGQCVACGTDIPVQRLGSLPMARYCRACQERLERAALPRMVA